MSLCVRSACHRYVVTMGVFLTRWHSISKIHISETADCKPRHTYQCVPIYYHTWRKQSCHYTGRCYLKGWFTTTSDREVKHENQHQASEKSFTALNDTVICFCSAPSWFIIKMRQTNTPWIKRPSLKSHLFINGPFFNLKPLKFWCKPHYFLTQSLATDTVAPLKVKKL